MPRAIRWLRQFRTTVRSAVARWAWAVVRFVVPNQDRLWFRLGTVALAFVLAWVTYAAFNVTLSATRFDHLDRMQTVSLREHQTFTNYGFGTDRPATGATRPRLLPQLLVVNQKAESVVGKWGKPSTPDGSGRSNLNARSVEEAFGVLNRELQSPAGPNTHPRHTNLFAQYVFYSVQLLRAKHWLRTTRDRGANGDEQAQGRHLRTVLFARDPLQLSSPEVERALAEVEKGLTTLALRFVAQGPSKDAPWLKLTEDEAKAYEDDLLRLHPLQANPHLIDDAPARTVASPVLTILYFPSAPRAAPDPAPAPKPAEKDQKSKDATKGGSKVDPKPAEPNEPERAAPAREYCYALELRADGGWGTGWHLDARYLLFDLNNPTEPITSSRTPALRVLERGSGWWGFRPAAVVTTEEQLAARLWSELEMLRKGAGINQPLAPDRESEPHYVRFVQKLLGDRLGRRSGAETRFMDDWVVWSRRANGGTGWGVIQFVVVIATFAFLLEFARLMLLVRGAGVSSGGAVFGAPLPRDLAELANRIATCVIARLRHAPPPPMLGTERDARSDLVTALEARMHTARYLVTALPLIGFLGSVAGLSNSLVGSSAVSSPELTTRQAALQAMQVALGTAFDKSMLAFFAAIVCLFLMSRLHRAVDRLRLG